MSGPTASFPVCLPGDVIAEFPVDVDAGIALSIGYENAHELIAIDRISIIYVIVFIDSVRRFVGAGSLSRIVPPASGITDALVGPVFSAAIGNCDCFSGSILLLKKAPNRDLWFLWCPMVREVP